MSPFEIAAAAYRRLEAPFATWLDKGGAPPSMARVDALAPSALLRRAGETACGERPWRPLQMHRADPRRQVRLCWGCAPTPFGEAVLAFDDTALWHLSFTAPGREPGVLLRRHLPTAVFASAPDPAAAARWAALAFDAVGTTPLQLQLSGTPFQFRTWQVLSRISSGRLCTYAQLAGLAGAPGAARAVGSAMARNPVAWLIPCHRVIRGDGELGHYQSGRARKALMLAWEAGVLDLPGWPVAAAVQRSAAG
jgi:O-6-methylguanine DNA methyltransferase